jgi:hypothetical protein
MVLGAATVEVSPQEAVTVYALPGSPVVASRGVRGVMPSGMRHRGQEEEEKPRAWLISCMAVAIWLAQAEGSLLMDFGQKFAFPHVGLSN